LKRRTYKPTIQSLKNSNPTSNNKKIFGLESLRFVAFLSIFIGHATPYWDYGLFSIHLFFVLSSFLLTYLLLKEIEQTNRFSRSNFLIRRGLRVYPLYYLVVGFSFIVLPIISNYTHQKITLPPNKLTYLLFISNFDFSDHIFPLKFLWSISVEEQFYLLFILLSFLFKKRFYTAISILISLYIGFRIYSWHYNYDYFDLLMHPCSYFVHYAAGMIAAKLYFEKKIPSLKQLIMLTAALVAVVVIMDKNKTSQLFDAIPLSALLSCIILIIAEFFKKFSTENKIFKATEYLGKYTYGLYVYSGFVIAFFLTNVHINSIILKAFIEFALLLPLSWLSYHLFEEKFLKLKHLFRSTRNMQNKKPPLKTMGEQLKTQAV
jgi:Predicted acyltransferases